MIKKPKGWLVLPCFNEARTIASVLESIISVLPTDTADFALCIVDDGSADDTFNEAVKCACKFENVSVQVIRFTRNFGKEAAIEAGLFACPADYSFAVVMDADLQHPPKLIGHMIEKWKAGFLIVHAVKSNRGRESTGYKTFANGFYSLFHLLSEIDIKNHTDFKLLDKTVVEKYIALPERKKFFRGLSVWSGVPTFALDCQIEEAVDGHESGWSTSGLVKYSISSILSFSSKPLRLFAGLGFTVLMIGMFLAAVSITQKVLGQSVDGFTTVIALLVLLNGAVIFGVGLLGLYLGEVFDELKSRPTYIIEKSFGPVDSLGGD